MVEVKCDCWRYLQRDLARRWLTLDQATGILVKMIVKAISIRLHKGGLIEIAFSVKIKH